MDARDPVDRAQLQERHAEAEALAAESERIFRELGFERGVMTQTHNRGLIAITTGDLEAARVLLERALAEAERLGSDQAAATRTATSASSRSTRVGTRTSVPLFSGALESALRTGWRINVGYTLRGLAGVLATRGELEPAARLLGAADGIEEQTGETLPGIRRDRIRAARRLPCSTASRSRTSLRPTPPDAR